MTAERLPRALRRRVAVERPFVVPDGYGDPSVHEPYWHPLLEAEFCVGDGEPWKCLAAREAEPEPAPLGRCRCSHGASVHTGGHGRCWQNPCCCEQFTDPQETP